MFHKKKSMSRHRVRYQNDKNAPESWNSSFRIWFNKFCKTGLTIFQNMVNSLSKIITLVIGPSFLSFLSVKSVNKMSFVIFVEL